MRLLVGQLAIILLVLGSSCLCYICITSNQYQYAWLIGFWAIIFIGLVTWSRSNPTNAFLTALVLYVATVIVKDIVLGGEYLLLMLVHLYFITSMLVGMKACIKHTLRN